MKKEFEQLALAAGGSHYPKVGGDNLESFGRLLLEECLLTIHSRTINEVHTDWEAGYNAALKKIASDLNMKFNNT